MQATIASINHSFEIYGRELILATHIAEIIDCLADLNGYITENKCYGKNKRFYTAFVSSLLAHKYSNVGYNTVGLWLAGCLNKIMKHDILLCTFLYSGSCLNHVGCILLLNVCALFGHCHPFLPFSESWKDQNAILHFFSSSSSLLLPLARYFEWHTREVSNFLWQIRKSLF